MNAPQFTKSILAVSIASALSGCIGGGSDSGATDGEVSKTRTTNLQMSGAVVDGYIENATVCLDINNNSQCDIPDEPSTKTDANGRFNLALTLEQTFDYTTARILVVGGVDTDTNKPFLTKLRAPLNPAKATTQSTETSTSITETKTLETNVTALTTLVAKTVDSGKTLEQAKETLKTVLGLTDAESLEKDPIAAVTQETDATKKAEAQKALAATVAINRAIETMVSAAKKADTNANEQTVSDGVLAAITQVALAQQTPTTTSVENLVKEIPNVPDAINAVQATVTETAKTQLTNATVVAAVTAKQTETLYQSVTDTKAIQEAALKSSNVVLVIEQKIEDNTIVLTGELSTEQVTAIESQAETAAEITTQQLIVEYLVNAGFVVSDNEETAVNEITSADALTGFTVAEILALFKTIQSTSADLTSLIAKLEATAAVADMIEQALAITLNPDERKSLRELSVSWVGLTSGYGLEDIVAILADGSVKTQIDAYLAEQALILAAANSLIDFLTTNAISLTDDEKNQIRELDVRTLNSGYTLTQVQTYLATTNLASVQDKVDAQIEQQAILAAANGLISFLTSNLISLDDTEQTALQSLDSRSLGDAYTLSAVQTFLGETDLTTIKEKVDTRLAEIAEDTALMTVLYHQELFEMSVTCAAGGNRVTFGVDANRNGLLDDNGVASIEICNGLDGVPNVSVRNAIATECGVEGGKVLSVDDKTFPFCNVTSVTALPSSPNYDQAKAMVAGFKTWISTVENYATEVQTSVETQAETLSSLMGADGVQAGIKVLGGLSMIMDYAFNEIVQPNPTSTSWDLPTLAVVSGLGLETEESLSGTLIYDADLNQFSLSEVTAIVWADGVLQTVTVSSGAIQLPGLVANTAFNADWSNVAVNASVDSTATGSIVMESLTVSAATTSGAVDIWAEGGLDSLNDLTLDLAMHGLNLSAVAGDKPIAFSGALTASLDMEKTAMAKMQPSQLTDASFNGSLAYDGQTVEVNLSLVVDQFKLDDITPFIEQLGFEFQAGQVIEDFITITASDDLAEFPGSISAVRYDVQVQTGQTFSFVVEEETLGSYHLYDVFVGADQNEDYEYLASSNDLESLKSSIKEDILYWSASNGEGWFRYDNQDIFQVYQRFDGERYVDGSLQLNASIDLSAGLPAVDSTTQWAYKVEDIDIYDQMPTFENHNRYKARAEVDLIGFNDSKGGTLDNAKLAILAERSGYLNASGQLEFALTIGEQTFTAHYTHPDVENEYAYSTPRRFVFSNNAGGMIEFNEPQYDYMYEGSLATPYRANLYYNGIEYGYLTRSWNGDWLVGYHDETEDRVYSAR